ncbi:nuclear pore complex component-domain-containing protein [Geopyxis carbonaria]|nr:nuclear pore complex component-domain-containing protein [Geopyxis carbonaria]
MNSSTASPATPATPGTYTLAPSTPTGSWRHPAMDVISRRQSESTFTDASFLKVTYNVASLIASWVIIALFKDNPTLNSVVNPYIPATIFQYANYAVWGLRMLFIWNIAESLFRLVRAPDDFSNVALTPDQRKLLGLNPNTPISPIIKSTDYVTPPRYTKSTPTSRASSPLPTGSSSPTLQRKAALNGGSMAGQDITSPMRMPRALWNSPASPSPTKKSGSSITPSNRWAYEKSITNYSK